jgi:predicted restriction endonuclease
LEGASQADRTIWKEFHQDWNTLAEESERLVEELNIEPTKNKKDSKLTPPDITEAIALTKQRRGQQFFRQTVLASFNYRCCITGNPIPELLRASHIASWKSHPEHRLNPQNGLCLAATQDAAFDRHLITLDEDLRIVLSKRLKDHFSNQSLKENFQPFEGKKIECPEKFEPDQSFLEFHRKNFEL